MPPTNGSSATHIFAGPSAGVDWEVWNRTQCFELRPPAVRNEIRALVEQRPAGTIILADGAFDREYAVSHREIMFAMNEGWTVFGVSSMGAIRAADLRFNGMIGRGSAFKYLVAENAPDDHLAVVHEARPPFRVLAESLFDVRAILASRATAEEATVIGEYVNDVAHWWFCDRTPELLLRHLGRMVGLRRAQFLLDPLFRPGYSRQKKLDLDELVMELIVKCPSITCRRSLGFPLSTRASTTSAP